MGRAVAEALIERGTRVLLCTQSRGGRRDRRCSWKRREQWAWWRTCATTRARTSSQTPQSKHSAALISSSTTPARTLRTARLWRSLAKRWCATSRSIPGGPLALVQFAVHAGLGRRPGAAVVNISTIGARQVRPMVAAYTASKAALDVLSKGVARELGPLGTRANSVEPGLVATTLSENLWQGEGVSKRPRSCRCNGSGRLRTSRLR